jgi:hypothetical protein
MTDNFPTFVFNRLNWGISVGENTIAPSQKKKNLNTSLGPHKLYITIITLFVNKNNIVLVRKSPPAWSCGLLSKRIVIDEN